MKADQPLISCIIPVYNAETYLRRCVDSVLKQDYPFMEIILIDDGSTDASSSLCDEYALNYSNVIVKHIPNHGASLARKLGLKLAKGEYVTFVDSDDYVKYNYISVMFSALQKYDSFIAGCGCLRVSVDCDVQDDVAQSSDILLSEEVLMTRFLNYEFWGLWGGLYSMSLFNNIDFPKETLSEDYYIKCQMFLAQCEMAYVDNPLYIYERHNASLSNTRLSERAFEEFENVSRVYELIKDNMPQFTSLALRNVIETCVKLLLMGSYSKRKYYSVLYRPIKIFLRNHTFDILRNRFLLTNVKIIAIILRICPSMSIVLNRL